MKNLFLFLIIIFLCTPAMAMDNTKQHLKNVSDNKKIKKAVKLLNNPLTDDSYNMILGNNPNHKVIRIEFANLSKYGEQYSEFDALGWQRKGQLYIYVNQKHKKENVYAISALLAGRSVHIDDEDSINEEVYATALEGATWGYYLKKRPKLKKKSSELIKRENYIHGCYVKSPQNVGYIQTLIMKNNAYMNYNQTSKGYSNSDFYIKIKNLYDAYEEKEYSTEI